MDQVLAIQSAAIDAAWEVLAMAQETGDSGGVIKAAHAISQAATSYAKIIETKDLERRIAELETVDSMPAATHRTQLSRAFA